MEDYFEIDIPLSEEALIHQVARCMDCGIPFCHGAGCPLNNLIPELHYFLQKAQWRKPCEILHATNNFPEITGRVCPAPCEAACTLSVNDKAVLIRHIEYQIAERGFAEKWIKPMLAKNRTGRRVAIVGSGPAGLAAAQQLARAGHEVAVYEKEDRVGGVASLWCSAFQAGQKCYRPASPSAHGRRHTIRNRDLRVRRCNGSKGPMGGKYKRYVERNLT